MERGKESSVLLQRRTRSPSAPATEDRMAAIPSPSGQSGRTLPNGLAAVELEAACHPLDVVRNTQS
jgi:hypothetical protein